MSTRPFARLVLAGLLLIAAASLRVAIAGASDLGLSSVDALATSAFPNMLGPINENGRVGWACRPERAAEASKAHMADLPTPDHR